MDIEKQISGKAKGGAARAESLSPERRKEIAMKGVEAKKEKSLLPQATHRGDLPIGDTIIPCAVLEDGTRVLSESGIASAMGSGGNRSGGAIKKKKTTELEGGAPLPVFMNSIRLEPFINMVFGDEPIIPISYKDGNKISIGYPATILPKICEVWLKAREAKVLQAQQLPKAMQAEILMRALAHIGIVALVDEATGYQKDRAKDELCKILEAFVAKELQPWLKTFPADFYENMFRLRDLEFPGNGVKRPQYFGHLTNDIIYRRLAPLVWKELKEQADKDAKGRLKHRLHQKLTTDIGHPKLKELIISVTTIMKLSGHWEDFKTKLDMVHPAYNETMQLPFDLENDSGKGI